jgi:diguanylate cyclase
MEANAEKEPQPIRPSSPQQFGMAKTSTTASGIDRLFALGAQMGDEVDSIIKLIDEAIGTTVRYNTNLTDASQQIEDTTNPDALSTIVKTLLRKTQEIEQQNRDLQAHLQSSRDEIAELQATLEVTRTEGLTDALTKLANRRHFDHTLETAILDSMQSGKPLSLIVCDVDHFKRFNDTFGHITGDQVLRLLGATLKQTVKGQDLAARYGGEEFAVILPNTALPQAMAVAENIRTAVSSKKLVNRANNTDYGRISVSVGVAEYRPVDDTDALVARADRCLYAAKQQGRNRVITELQIDSAAA